MINNPNNFHFDSFVKPRNRSQTRLYFGKLYFILKRLMQWQLNKSSFASKFDTQPFRFLYFKHQTPLIRSLNKVDNWMQINKITNLSIAAKKINGIVIQPGETFSYWKLIGKPCKRKGYKDGMILFHGTLKPGIGGGLCQLSNLIFWMALHSPLTIKERHRHSYDVFPDVKRELPFGSGATCVYNYRDLQLVNNTEYPIQILVSLSKDELIGEIRSVQIPVYHYEVYEKGHIIKQLYWGGFSRHNILFRKTFENNKLIADEYLFENHALMMYQPFLS